MPTEGCNRRSAGLRGSFGRKESKPTSGEGQPSAHVAEHSHRSSHLVTQGGASRGPATQGALRRRSSPALSFLRLFVDLGEVEILELFEIFGGEGGPDRPGRVRLVVLVAIFAGHAGA